MVLGGISPLKNVPWTGLGVASPGGYRQAEWLEYGSQTHRGDEPKMEFFTGKLPGFAEFEWALRCIWNLGARQELMDFG